MMKRIAAVINTFITLSLYSNRIKQVFLFTAWCFCTSLMAQQSIMDSLKKVLIHAKNDTVICSALSGLASLANDKEWPEYNRQLLALCNKRLEKISPNDTTRKFYLQYIAAVYNNQALREDNKGNIMGSLELHEKSLKIKEELENKSGIANSLAGMGYLYGKLGNIPKALEYYERALRINESIKNKAGMALCFNNIAMVYRNQKEYEKALAYLKKSLAIEQESENKERIASYLHNIAAVYKNMKDTARALEYFQSAINLREEIKDSRRLAGSLVNVAMIYLEKNELDKAEEFLNRSSLLQKEFDDELSKAFLLISMGKLQMAKKNISKAENYSLEAMKIGREIKYPEIMRNAAYLLSILGKQKGDFKRALGYYETYILMRDSISSEANKKATISSQLKYEFEKKAAADSVTHAKETELKNAELARQSADIKARKNQQYALFGGLGLVIVFSVFMFNRYKVARLQKAIIEKQKSQVEEQKILVDEKQKEILDSIHYARRIQMTLLPGEQYIFKLLQKLKRDI